MNIAYISSKTPGEIDRLLSTVAHTLQSQQKRLTGIVKAMDYTTSYDNGCDMEVNVLPDGPRIKITQSLGAGSDACRLNPVGIAEAVSAVETQPMQEADLFILNKFGPEEAAGRGFCNVIGQALEHQVPVLVGVGTASIPAFDTFSDGMAVQLAADESALLAWAQRMFSGETS
ncbi:MAG: DUF2478 domain-containing protein [Granulosicoccaceae bacterium]